MAKIKVAAVDNHGKSYNVHLENQAMGIALVIEGTPGRWYLSTLVNGLTHTNMQKIAIDMGQEWYCINFRQVLQSALNYVCALEV